jgi:hypothetical protein
MKTNFASRMLEPVRMVWVYAVVMSAAAVFALLSPALAQVDKPAGDEPDVRWDVKKEYDRDGRLSRCDSAWSWSWQGHGQPPFDMDSLFGQFHEGFEGFGQLPGFDRDEFLMPFGDPFDWPGMPALPPFHFYPHEGDTSFAMPFEDPWFDDADSLPGAEHFNRRYPGIPFGEPCPPGRFYDDEELKLDLKGMEDFNRRYREYLEEHRKLIEKYFPMRPEGLPGDSLPGALPNQYRQRRQDDDHPRETKI